MTHEAASLEKLDNLLALAPKITVEDAVETADPPISEGSVKIRVTRKNDPNFKQELWVTAGGTLTLSRMVELKMDLGQTRYNLSGQDDFYVDVLEIKTCP